MLEYLVVGFAVCGTFFAIVATVGLLRFPDVFTRAHAISKSDTLGVGLVLLAAAVFDGSPSTAVKLLALGAFMLVTNPVAAHVLTRSAQVTDVVPWTRDREKSEQSREGPP